MKRLLCILSNMNAGGAETFLMKLYRTIDRSQYQMDFCVNLYEKNFYEDEINSLGGRVFKIPSRKEDFKAHNKCLAAIIRDNSYKYVLAVSAISTCFIDLKLAKKAGAEVCSVRSSNSSFGMSMKANAIHFLFRLLYMKYADVMFAPSDLAAISLFGKKSVRSGKVIFLHNAINYEKFKFSLEDRVKHRSLLHISDDCMLIGHVGRFNTQKNHEKLIDVFYTYHQMNKKSKLLLVGIGNLQEMIKKKVECLNLSEDVIFLGLRNDVNSLLSAMDIFVMPSFYEGMPNVVIEAQANGLPCVISDTITREANITGLVKFAPLNGDDSIWASYISENIGKRVADTYQKFRDNNYLIEDAAKLFVTNVFKKR